MKLNCLFFIAFLGIVAFTGCSDDSAPADTSALNSVIALDRGRVGVGQPVVLSAKVPALSKDVKSVEYSFYENDKYISSPVAFDNGTCSITWIPTNSGNTTLSFMANYTFERPDKGGNPARNEVVTTDIEVIPCDVRNSFWGDSVAETQKNGENSLTQDPENTNKWSGEFPNPFDIFIIDAPNANVTYTFTNGKLSSVVERFLYPITNTAALSSVNPYLYFQQYAQQIKDYTLVNSNWNAISDDLRVLAEKSHAIYIADDLSSENYEKRTNAIETLNTLITYESVFPVFTYENTTNRLTAGISQTDDKINYVISLEYSQK